MNNECSILIEGNIYSKKSSWGYFRRICTVG